MEISSIITLSIIVVAVTAGYFIVYYVFTGATRKEEKQKLKELHAFAASQNSTLQVAEHTFNVTVGLDTVARKLFFMKSEHDRKTDISVDLTNYETCRLNITRMSHEYHKEEVSVIDRIDLVLMPSNPSAKQVKMEVYSSDVDNLTLSGELQFAEEWRDRINNLLSEMKKERKVTGKVAQKQRVAV